MIIDVSDKSKLQWQISENIRELKSLRRSYQDRININYARLRNIKPMKEQMEVVNGGGNEEFKKKASLCLTDINTLNNRISFNIIISKEQRSKVNKALNTLYDIFNTKKDDEIVLNSTIKDYNDKYRKIKNSFDNNAFQEERVMQLFLKVNNDSNMIYNSHNDMSSQEQEMNEYVQSLREQVQDLNEKLNESISENINTQTDTVDTIDTVNTASSAEPTQEIPSDEVVDNETQENDSEVFKNISASSIAEVENLYIKDNDTLLISEVQDKVVLPYFGEEIEEKLILEGHKYKNAQEVIDDVYTRKLSDYSNPFKARFMETYNLVTKKDRFPKMDGVKLGLELAGERYLHPAVISACRNTDELDTYLDCLKKGEVNDFQIFNIKYELHPMVTRRKRR